MIERLMHRTALDPETGCWLWRGAATADGYGHMVVDGPTHRQDSTHRIAYELMVGPIPDGLVIDHLCRTPSCCNPDHLEAVTSRENTRRGIAGPKVACVHGHAFDEDNTAYYPDGRRRCRACHRDRERERSRRKREDRR